MIMRGAEHCVLHDKSTTVRGTLVERRLARSLRVSLSLFLEFSYWAPIRDDAVRDHGCW